VLRGATRPRRLSERASDPATLGHPGTAAKGSRKRRRSLSTRVNVSHLTLFPHRVKGPQKAPSDTDQSGVEAQSLQTGPTPFGALASRTAFQRLGPGGFKFLGTALLTNSPNPFIPSSFIPSSTGWRANTHTWTPLEKTERPCFFLGAGEQIRTPGTP
jgi:hypothetical protein